MQCCFYSLPVQKSDWSSWDQRKKNQGQKTDCVSKRFVCHMHPYYSPHCGFGSTSSCCLTQAGLSILRWRNNMQEVRESEPEQMGHAKQMPRESWGVKRNKQTWRSSHSTCILNMLTKTHTRLPEASFRGLSVKPYIHTADKEKEEQEERERGKEII